LFAFGLYWLDLFLAWVKAIYHALPSIRWHYFPLLGFAFKICSAFLDDTKSLPGRSFHDAPAAYLIFRLRTQRMQPLNFYFYVICFNIQ